MLYKVTEKTFQFSSTEEYTAYGIQVIDDNTGDVLCTVHDVFKPWPRRPHPELWTALSGVPGRPYSYPIQARAPHHIYIRLPPAALPNW